MSKLGHHYFSNVSWNALYTVYYRFLYTIYFFLLYAVVDQKTFGTIGTCISFLYLGILLFDLGIVPSLTSFRGVYSQSKQAFLHYLWLQFLAYIVLFFIITPFLITFYFSKYSKVIIMINESQIVFLFLSIFILELIKKLLKKNLDLAFYYKETALIEIVSITIFFGLLVTHYLYTSTLTGTSVFSCLLISSFISVALLSWYTVKWYRSLPQCPIEKLPKNTLRYLIKTCLFANIAKVQSIVFSSNFLIPIIAVNQGVEIAGLFKLVGNVAHSCSLLLGNTFGGAGEMLLSNLKDEPLQLKQQVFYKASRHLYHGIFLISLFLVINHSHLLSMTTYSMNNELLVACASYFLILMNSIFFNLYRSLFIIQNSLSFFVAISIPQVAAAYALLTLGGNTSICLMLCSLLCMQIMGLSAIALYAKKAWCMGYPLAIDPFYACGSLALSLLFFFSF